MARKAIRDPRYIPTPRVIGYQPDLFDGPTITNEVRAVPVATNSQLAAWRRADTVGDLDGSE